MREEERYEIQGKLGEGGRGAVYLAKDRQLNRTVAIKRLFSEEQSAEKDYEAVLHESRALSAINSPHIVRVFDVCQDEEGPYVVMEHLKGKNLHDVVSNAPLVEQDFLEIAEQALEALIAAHEARLLHRDIKPGNLMLTWLPSGRFNLKLLDFGLAKFAAAPAVQTMAHGASVMGSIYFMAPEQFDRKPLDQRTDLYSLGCVFFFALTGEYPFDGDNVTEVMASHVQGRHKDLSTMRPDLPSSLCEWVTHFISVNPDDRPGSAQEAIGSLADAKRGSFTRIAPKPIAPQLLTGPVTVGPATGPVPGISLHSTDHVLAAQVPATTSVPLAVPVAQTTPSAPAPRTMPSVSPSSTIPTWLLVTMGTLALLVIVLGIAIVLIQHEPAPPNPTPPPSAATNPPAPAGKPPESSPPEPRKPTPVLVKPAIRPPSPPRNGIPPSRKQLLKTFNTKDRNKDGQLTLSEWVTSKNPQATKQEENRFRTLDKNKDGKVSAEEFTNPPKPKPKAN